MKAGLRIERFDNFIVFQSWTKWVRIVFLLICFQTNYFVQAETLGSVKQAHLYCSGEDRIKLMQLYHQLDSSLAKNVVPEFIKDSLFSEHYRYSTLVSDVVYCLKLDFVSLLDSQQINKILSLCNGASLNHVCAPNSKKSTCCKYSFLDLFKFRLIQLNYISKIDSVKQAQINTYKQINGNVWLHIDTGSYYIHSEKNYFDSNKLTNWVYKFYGNGTLRFYVINGSLNKAMLDSADYEEYFFRFDEKSSSCVIENYYFYPIYRQLQQLYQSLIKGKMDTKGFKFVKFDGGEVVSSNLLYKLNWYYKKTKIKD